MIDLHQFCSTASGDPGRPYLHAPFSLGDKTYATNGHILVCVPRVEGVSENPIAPDKEKIKKAMGPLDFGAVTPVKFKKMPESRNAWSATFRGCYFAVDYLLMLSRLPNLRAAPKAYDRKPILFTWDDGYGVLMGLAWRYDYHLDDAEKKR